MRGDSAAVRRGSSGLRTAQRRTRAGAAVAVLLLAAATPWAQRAPTGHDAASRYGRGFQPAATNQPPEFEAAEVERAVAENSAAGTEVGAAVTASDADDAALSYALGGTDAARFAIDATSGQIRVGAGTVLDHEAGAGYALVVEVRDGRDADGNAAPGEAADATVAVAVTVSDADEPPPAPPALAVTAADATSLTVRWTAPDTTGRPAVTGYVVRYRLSGESRWTRHAHEGTATQATIGGLTANSRYRVRVSAVNDEGTGAWTATGGETAPAPVLDSVVISSQAGSDDTYAIGDRIEVRASFNTAVTVSGGPTLALGIGSATREADYDAVRSAGAVVVFSYPVAEGDRDGDGVTIAADALAAGGGVIGSGTLAATRTHAAVGADAAHKVDGVRPSITAAPSVTSRPSRGDGYYRSLEKITVALSFSETVQVSGTPRLGLSVGSLTWPASYGSGARSATLSFDWTVKPTDLDTDGISVAANGVMLRGGVIADLAGNAALLSHAALAAQTEHKVAGARAVPRFGRGSKSFTIAEDHADGATLGTVTARDGDAGDVLRYGLSGDALFVVRASGPDAYLAVAEGARLSYETAVSHAMTVTATDPAGLSAALEVTVAVSDVLEPALWPEGFTLVLTNVYSNSVTVNWVKPSTPHRPPVGYYRVVIEELDQNGNSYVPIRYREQYVNDAEVTAVTVTGLKTSTRYEASIQAVNEEATSRAPSRARFTTLGPNEDPKGYNPATCEEDASELTLTAAANVQVELGPLHGTSSQEGQCAGSLTGQASYFWDPDGDQLRMTVELEEPPAAPAAVWSGTIGGAQAPVIDAGGTKLQYLGVAARGATEVVAVVTAHDNKGGTATRRVRIDVGSFAGSAAPRFAETVGTRRYEAGAEVTLVLPEASGGDLRHAESGATFDYEYALSGSLPPGLSFDAETRTISGAPEVSESAVGAYRLTYTAQDADQEQGTGDTASLTFTIEIPPWVTDVWLSWSHANRDGREFNVVGDEVWATARVSAPVTVSWGDERPSLVFQVGDEQRLARYSQASLPKELFFSYAVQEGDEDRDGVSIIANSLRLNGATITGAGGVTLTLEHEWWPPDSRHRVDAVRPAFASAAVSGTELTVTYDEALDPGSAPAGSRFTATATSADNPSRDLAGTGTVAVTGATATVTLASAVAGGETVTLAYTKGEETSPLQDGAGNEAADFAGREVSNDTPAAPGAPGAPTVIASAMSLTVSWSAPASLGTASSITDYDLRYYAGADDPSSEGDWVEEGETNGPPDPGAGRTVTITGLSASTAYRVQVRAMGDLESPWSASGSATTPSATAPAQGRMDGLTAVAGDGRVTLVWAYTPGANAWTGWHYQRKAGAGEFGGWQFLPGPTREQRSHTFSDVANGTTYAYRMRAYADGVSNVVSSNAVTPNALPAAADGSVTTNEDSAHTFAAAEFSFSDSDTGDTLASVKVTALPAAGALKLSGAAIGSGDLPQAVTKAQLDAGSLAFEPVADAHGAPYATFRFKVNDGTADSAAAYTMTVNVTAVNDAPALANAIPDQAATAGAAFSFQFAEDTFSDADGDTLIYTAAKSDDSALPSWLTFTEGTRTFAGTPQASDIGTVTVKVTASDGNGGSADDTFDLVVSAAASVTDVEITSDPGDGDHYGIGDTVEVTVTFSDAVVVDTTGGTPRLKIKMDPGYGERWAEYASGSGTTALVFDYAVVSPNASPQGVAVLANTLELNGGTIHLKGTQTDAALAHVGRPHDADHRIETVAPVLQSAAVEGTALTLTWGEALDTGSAPSGSAFTVTATPPSGSPRDIAGTGTATVSGATVSVTLAYAVAHGETVTGAYAKPGASPLQDIAGNDAADFTGVAVANNAPKAPEVSAVALVSAPAEGQGNTYKPGDVVRARVTFDAAVDVAGGNPGLRVRLSSSMEKEMAFDTGPGVTNTTTLEFTYTVAAGDASAGLGFDADSLSAGSGVTIRATGTEDGDAVLSHAAVGSDPAHKVDGVAPALQSAVAVGSALTLTWDEALDAGSAPSGSAFTVTATPPSGSPRDIAGTGTATVSGAAVSVTLASAVVHGETVTVSYTKAANPIRDALGNEAANLSGQAVSIPPPVPPEISIGAGDPVNEGTAATFTVTAAPAPAVDLTVNLELAQTGEFVAPGDLGAKTVTVPVSGSAELQVATEDDAVAEAHGSVTVKVTAGTGYTVHATEGAATVAVNDNDAPALSGAAVNGRVVQLTFSQDLDSTAAARPAAGAFTVMVGGVRRSVVGVSIFGTTVKLTLSSEVVPGETVTVAYERPASGGALQSPSGLVVASFGARVVRQVTPERPAVHGAEVTGDRVTVTFDRALDPDRMPSASRFSVEQYSRWYRGIPVRRVDIDRAAPRQLVLTLSRSVLTGDVQPIWMHYSQGGDANALRGVYGQPVRDYSRVTVANRTRVPRWGDPGTEKYAQVGQWVHDSPCGQHWPGVTRSEQNLGYMYVCDMARRQWTLARFPIPGVDYRGTYEIDWTLVIEWNVVPGRCILRGYDDLADAWYLLSTSDAELCERARAATEAREGRAIGFQVALALPAAPGTRKTVAYETAGGTATPGRDYVPARGTLVFGPGEHVKTVRVRTLRDAEVEGPETVRLRLFNAQGFTLSEESSERVGTIADAGAASVTGVAIVSNPGPDATYGPGEAVAAAVTFDAAVRVEGSGGTPTLALIADGRIVRASYASGSGTARLVFAYRVGEDDGSLRAVRVASSGLKLGGGAIVDAAHGTAAALGFGEAPGVTGVAIADEADGRWAAGDEVEVTLSFAEPVTAGGALSVGLVLERAVRRAAYTSGSGSEALMFGYTLGEGEGPWGRAAVAGDSLRLDGGSLSSAGGGLTVALAHGPAARTLTPPAVLPSLTVTDTHAAEGGTLAFAVRLDAASTAAVTVAYATADGTAAAGEDYTATSGTLTFAPGETGKTVEVAALADEAAEDAETFTLSLSNAQGAAIGDGEATGTVADVAPGGPAALTASFHGVPAEHDGERLFSFELRFSEDFPGRLDYKVLRDAAFRVENGRVREAKRMARGQNRRWEIAVRPASFEDVTVTLPAGSVTTDGGRALANTVWATVRGPALLSVADAEAREGVDEAVEFEVSLSRAASGTVTVEHVTRDGTAVAGEDYEWTRGTLTFAVGETGKTVSVPILDDGHDEGRETFTLKLRNATGAWIIDGEATGAILNTDAMPRAWLARFGRTVAESVLDGVQARLEAPRAAGSHARVAGQALRAFDDAALARLEAEALARWLAGTEVDGGGRAPSGPQVLAGSAFAVTAAAAPDAAAEAGSSGALWGRGGWLRFDGREDGLSVDGEVLSATLGADYAWGRWLAGALLSHARGSGSYNGEAGAGTVESTLTGVWPYAGVDLSERLTAWAAAGAGLGGLTLTPAGARALETDLTLLLAALGARGRLVEPEGGSGFTLAIETDGYWVRTSSGAAPGLAEADADATRLRLGLDGGYRFMLDGGGTLEPTFEIGVRHDGGDAETGYGVDAGARLSWTHGASGINARLGARALLHHEAAGLRDWGLSGSLGWDPAPGSALGPSLTLAQTLGARTTGGMDALLARATLAGLAGEGGASDGVRRRNLDLRLAYGVGLPPRGVLTPFAEAGLSGDDSRRFQLGTRFEASGADLTLQLSVERRESAAAAPDHALRLEISSRF